MALSKEFNSLKEKMDRQVNTLQNDIVAITAKNESLTNELSVSRELQSQNIELEKKIVTLQDQVSKLNSTNKTLSSEVKSTSP